MNSKQTKLLLAESDANRSMPVECLGYRFRAKRHGETTSRRSFVKHSNAMKRAISKVSQLATLKRSLLCLIPRTTRRAQIHSFLGDMIAHNGQPYVPDDGYRCEPFASDVSVGKNDTIYMAHSYHTKVPHQAILSTSCITRNLATSFWMVSVVLE